MKKLPVGIQTFSKIIEGNYCYVDKTPLIARMADEGEFYFFSRPRRFGKSLLIDTIAEAFLGNKKLFTGLYLEHNWDWEQKHPVLQIDFAQGIITTRKQLDTNILEMIHIAAKANGITLRMTETSLAFSELIRLLHQKTGQRVVVLVDEYDKPILDNIVDPAIARELRDGLRNFYSVLKAQGAHLRFVLLTGVSKFSKVSIFSGLNNLEDITLASRFGTICGYTQQELVTVFHEYLDGIDLEQVQAWYNGYNFLAEPVYNPFDVLLFFKNKQFKPYWFETGTPSFLIQLLADKKIMIPDLYDLTAGEELLSSFDIDFLEPAPLLFQTGYLTIKETEHLFDQEYVYHLGFPNHEVQKSLTGSILHWYVQDKQPINRNQMTLFKILKANELDKLETLFHAFFASIPHDWYRKNSIANYEGYYCSVVYCYFTALGLHVQPEISTNHGQIDMTVFFNNRIYIIEFKVNELTLPKRALSQIKEKRYYEKYDKDDAQPNREIYLIGIEFSKEERNISRFEWEQHS